MCRIGWMASIMRAEHFLCIGGRGVWGGDLVPVCVWAPGGLGCCSFWGLGSVVDFMFSVTPIYGVCNGSMFCCTLLCVHSRVAVILMGRGAGCFAWFVFLVSRGG